MTNEGSKEAPFEQRSVYPGMSVKKYEAGDMAYEVEGLKDNYGSEHRMGFVVGRDGNVTLTLSDIENPPLQIQFNATESATPNMAHRFERIARALFEKGGERLDDETDLKVSSVQEKLKILKKNNYGNDIYIGGIVGDGTSTVRMNLSVGQYADFAIELFQLPGEGKDYHSLVSTYAASGTGRFHQAILYELRGATTEIATSRE